MKDNYQTLKIGNLFPKKKLINQRVKSNSLETKLQKYNTDNTKYIYKGNNHKNLSKKNQLNDDKNSSLLNITDSLDDSFELDLDNDKNNEEEELNSDEYISSTNLDVETHTYIDENEHISDKKNNKSNIYNKGKIIFPPISRKSEINNFYEGKQKKLINEEKNAKINYFNLKFREYLNVYNKNNKIKNIKGNKPSIYKKVDLNKLINNECHTINNPDLNNKKILKNINKKYPFKKQNSGIIEKSNTEENIIITNNIPKEKEPLTIIINKKNDIPKNEIYSRFSKKKLKTGNNSYTIVNTNTNANNLNNNSNKENIDTNNKINTNRNIKITSFNIDNHNSKSKVKKKIITKKINRINSLKKSESLKSPTTQIHLNQNINNINNTFIFSPLRILAVNSDERNTTPTEINHKYPYVNFIYNTKNLNNKISKNNKNIPNIKNSNRSLCMNNKNIIFFNLKNKNSFKSLKSNKVLIKKKSSCIKKDNNNSFAAKKNPFTKSIMDHKKTVSSFSPKSQRIVFNKKINLNLSFLDTHIYSAKNKIFPKKEIISNKTNTYIGTNQTNNFINTIENSRITNTSNYNKNSIYETNANKNIKPILQNSEIILVKKNSKAKNKNDNFLSSFGNKNNVCSFYQIYKSNKNLFKKDFNLFSPNNSNNYSNTYFIKKKINYSNNQSYNSNLNNSINKSNTIMTTNNSCMNDEKKKINYKKHFIALNTNANTNKCRKLKKFIPIDRSSPSNLNKRLIKEYYANNNVITDNFNTFNDSYSFLNKDHLIVGDCHNKRKK